MRGWIPTGLLAATLLFGSTANAGVITGGLTEDPCKIEKETTKMDSGVITGGITGVITGGFGVITGGFGVITGGLVGTGIIVTDLSKDEAPVNCGIIVTD